jgi:hypothetical protein
MKRRKGFTLIELVVATFIFGFIIIAMAIIYSTITRYMHQNYRQDVWKTNTALAMRTIHHKLLVATRIDSPAFGASGAELKFAVNVDQLTGCYPISPGDPVTWHYFYLGSVSPAPPLSQLFYCSGNITGGAGCANSPPFPGAPSYTCVGASPPILILDHVAPIVPVFSRQNAQDVNERDTVAVNLRIHWDPTKLSDTGKSLGASQRVINYSLKTVIKINRPAEGQLATD